MTIPLYIRRAVRSIDRFWFAPRRRAKLIRAMGCEDACTKFDIARKHHRPTRALEGKIKAACHERLKRELAQ